MKSDHKEEFKKIYAATSRKIYAAALSGADNISDAEDIFQETYVELFNALRAGKKIHTPVSFLNAVLRRKLSKHYKEIKRSRNSIKSYIQADDDENTELFIDDIDIENSIITDSLYDTVSAKLRSKPQEIQKIFTMYYSLDMKLDDIAAELGVSPSYVKNKLYRTLKELRKCYTGTEEQE